MKTLVLYYSHTGTTRKLAEVIARTLGADIGQITCPQYESHSKLTYMFAGMFSLLGWLPKIQLPIEASRKYDLVLIGSPIWTGYPALPVRRLLRDHGDLCQNIGLFITGGNPSPPLNAIAMMKKALDHAPVAILACNSKEVTEGGFRPKLDKFLSTLELVGVIPSIPHK